MRHYYSTIRVEQALIRKHATLLRAGDVAGATMLGIAVERKADKHFAALKTDPGRHCWNEAKWRGYSRIAAIMEGHQRGWDAHFAFINDLDRDISDRKRKTVAAARAGVAA